ncbi:hypothetical protein B0T22DRAFT_104674 [Podospora appendiculata]|uniref:Uncharacterized protein n=1 Tax=Podospora appendiculata TaxID=314037 RepID=A0AAE0XL52_9PEZI|nr:hypothetical protein B0T22DRAFT_104674 [Podospora appendiculata]
MAHASYRQFGSLFFCCGSLFGGVWFGCAGVCCKGVEICILGKIYFGNLYQKTGIMDGFYAERQTGKERKRHGMRWDGMDLYVCRCFWGTLVF